MRARSLSLIQSDKLLRQILPINNSAKYIERSTLGKYGFLENYSLKISDSTFSKSH